MTELDDTDDDDSDRDYNWNEKCYRTDFITIRLVMRNYENFDDITIRLVSTVTPDGVS